MTTLSQWISVNLYFQLYHILIFFKVQNIFFYINYLPASAEEVKDTEHQTNLLLKFSKAVEA